MCGLSGLFDLRDRREPDRNLLQHMTDSLSHRGPDGSGIHLEAGVGLGHRRLAIIDLAGGQQPLFNEDHSVSVVFNGEIYNFSALADELRGMGHRFRTRSDTEVIVHAWESWGPKCVERFQGMFAFALWDRNRERLFLARDPMGIKPLYYAQLPDGWLAFASELKALQSLPNLRREINPLAVESYVALGYIPDPQTIYKETHKLPPAHHLQIQRDAPPLPNPQRYWSVSFRSSWQGTEAEAGAELVERFCSSVRSHMVSDVPVGTFLSGGIDSSAVAAMMAGATQDPITACTVSFSDAAFDESPQARQVAERYTLHHQLAQADPERFDLLDQMVTLYDEPFADASAWPTYLVCEQARKRVKVVLSGDGGDESLAGYRRYGLFQQEQRLRALLPLKIRGPLFGVLGRLYPKLDRAPRFLRAKSTFQALARDTVDGYFDGVSILDADWRNRLLKREFRQKLQGFRAEDLFRHHAKQIDADHPVSLVQALDMQTFLQRVLTKVDRASMAHGLEVRVPMLDHKLVAWVARLPIEFKLRGGVGKHLFRRALGPYLPDEILNGRKQGFSPPLAAWLRGPLSERLRERLCGPLMGDAGFFEPDTLKQMVDLHLAGKRNFAEPLWMLLMFEGFLQSNQEL
ncbi:MAG: amidotransferase 1, exosortase A system-associated [Magnetococcales bacterium]|nr:amidotransferase 1, exosortase A system-associated [Magnetococcales bacterium]